MANKSTNDKPVRALPAMHPGELLREDIIPALDIKVTALARLLRVSRQTLHAILREEAPVTPAMALKLGKLCGNGPRLWVNLQREYDLEKAAKAMKAELKSIPTLKVVA
jgi:antitoxin HigA-1